MSAGKKYSVSPKIVLAGQETIITFFLPPDRPAEAAGAAEPAYRLLHIALQQSGGALNRDAAVPVTWNADGTLSARILFAGEQEHQLRLYAGEADYDQPAAVLTVYSVEADLYARTPYKGDLHMHSCRSDGLDTPAHVAAACRRIGLDFMALTDHGQYAPSIEAQEAFAHAAVDLRIFRGEEVHAPDNPLHIINFGGCFSINTLFKQPGFSDEIAQRVQRTGSLPPGVDRYQYAVSTWIFDQIRRAGGLGIYCHPYWFWPQQNGRQGYYINEPLISHLFDTQPYDALELLGGYHLYEADSNILQVARYQDERAKGRAIPIVGVSDAHGCETGKLFGWFYTLVFAAGSDLPDLIAGIKGLYSVAIEALPNEVVRVYGPFRLVKFALFLLREVFPEHDALCAEEGRAMLAMIGEKDPGDSRSAEQAAEWLQTAQGRAPDYINQAYGRK
ncbi:MAG: hypothetical protein VB070_04135 [Clostridiaceae bacterium]|nr:hypothetical protein [Clostridiaceae bacterium]